MKRESAVVFDLDGTLVDSRKDLVDAMSWLLSELGHPPRPFGEVVSYVGKGVESLVRRSLPEEVARDEEALLRAVTLFRRRYGAHLADATRPYRGVEEAIERMAARGAPLFVLTNKPGGMARRLMEALGLTSLFRGVLGAGDVPAHKPDPAGLIAICKEAGVAPARAWYVGDMGLDVKTARAAGCKAALVTWGYEGEAPVETARPDRIIRRPEDLIHLLDDGQS